MVFSDAEWAVLGPLVEACRPHAKVPPSNLRRTMEAIVWRCRNGAKWRAIPAELPGMPPVAFDGITELWFDSVDDLAAVFTDPEYLARIRPDEASFLDLPRCEFVVSEENPVFPKESS